MFEPDVRNPCVLPPPQRIPPRPLPRASPRLQVPLALARGLPQPHQRLPL